MHTGRVLFPQLMDFLPKHEFNKCIHRYRGNYRARHFKRYDQFVHGLCATDRSGEPAGHRDRGREAAAILKRVWII